MKMRMVMAVAAGLACAACAQVIDDSDTRVQTTLDPGLTRIGTLRPKGVGEIGTSRWTLGCKTMDREYTDYDAFKDIPVYDAPAFIADKALLSIMPANH